MNDDTTKLVILRGPSGSGKTTTAKILFDKAGERTALIEQDYYRFIFNPPGGGSKPNSSAIHEMIKNDVLIALKHGYDVILEGILSVRAYEKVLEDIFKAHPKNNFIFYFDITFEETVKRHKKRQAAGHTYKGIKKLIQDEKRAERLQQFGGEEMIKWYDAAHKSDHKFEHVIPESNSIEETISYIRKVADI